MIHLDLIVYIQQLVIALDIMISTTLKILIAINKRVTINNKEITVILNIMTHGKQ
jgi:hypothetical protein